MSNKFKFKHTQYAPFSEKDIEMIHDASVDLLSSYGIRVAGDEAHEILHAAGCEIDEEKDLVKIPKNVIIDCIESAPEKFKLYGRDTEKCYEMGGEDTHFSTFSTGVAVYDLETDELHDSTLADLKDIVRLADSLDEIDKASLTVAATDYHPDVRPFYEFEAIVSNTTKHFSHDAEGGVKTKKLIDMAAAVRGGYDELKKYPLVTMGCCPNSPLEIPRNESEQIIESAKAFVPMNVLSMGLCGGTTPMTLSGSIMITNCEVLTGIILAQLTQKGTPVLYGSSTTIMDMKTTTTPVGAPEHAMISSGAAQVGNYYGIPTYVGGT